MILVKNKWFPFGNYKAINICGIVFYKGDNLSDKTINHEKIHILTQQLNLIKTNKDKIIAESNRELETFNRSL